MDALAVSVSTGICVPDLKKREAVKIGLYFGGFQALMPTLGWLLGTSVIDYISAFDHWIAFGLLAVIGIKMVGDAVRGKEEKNACGRRDDMLTHKALFFMAVATSIDALAVGVSLAMVKASIAVGAAVIGGTSLFGGRGKARDAVLGGLVIALIENGLGLLGTKAYLSYLITGVVLLFAASIDALAGRRRSSAGR